MEALIWVLLGIAAGGITAYTLHDNQGLSGYIDVAFGVIGAMVAGFFATIFSLQTVAGLYDETIVLSVFGAGFLIWLGREIFLKGTYE